jgi:two-component system, chemotaxis family, chemotaxis protein CheY
MAADPLNVQEVADLHILVVEDNQNMRTLMNTMVRMLGVENYTQAINGQDALGALQVATDLPDVILIDIKMEPVNGIELTRRIRHGDDVLPSATDNDDGDDKTSDDDTKNDEEDVVEVEEDAEWSEKRKTAMNERQLAISKIPIIIFSAYSEVDRVVAARDAGANDFLAKPLSPRIVLEHITMVLRNPGEFIELEAYTGPDRRRDRPGGFDGDDRRGDAPPTETPSADEKAC